MILQSLRRSAALLFVAAVLVFAIPAPCFAGEVLFPVYPEIRNNVEFWKQIYSSYNLSQGVVHDKHDLGIVYEIVSLNHPDSYRSRKDNNRKVKRVKKRLRKVLRKLAKGGQPSNSEEQRILDLFGETPSKKRLNEAAKNIRVQLGQKDRFRKGVIRSGAFIKRIKKIFREEGVPSDLAHLAHVESSFNVSAYSKFGAAGIWQFTRSTGKKYLKINYTVDERRDPILASRAAARFLRDNYRKLSSWPLAITAYNHGVGGMTRAQQKHGGYQSVFRNYNGRTFGFASKNFYSEFLAASEVAREYRRYFGELPKDSPWPMRQVTLEGYANASKLADHFGVDLALIRKYNPALRPPVFEGQKYIPKGHSLRLPGNSSELVRLASNIPENIFSTSQKRSQFYRVRRGDTAGVVARMHGVTLNELVLANQLNRRATIYAGQNLRIPSLGGEQIVLSKSYKSQVAEPALELPRAVKLLASPEQPPFPDSPTVVAMIEDLENASEDKITEDVRVIMNEALPEGVGEQADIPVYGGDLFFGIDELVSAGNGNLAWPPLLADTGVEDDVAGNGLMLIDINPQLVVGQLQVDRVYSEKGKTYGVITVEAEETLGHYADWLGIPTWKIRRHNRLRYGEAIMVGQEIRIPLKDGVRDVFEEKRYEFHKELIEDFFAAYRVEKIRKYTIRPGDNIWSLCRIEFDLPFWLVRQYNQSLEPSGLRPAQELLIPVVSRRQMGLASLTAEENAGS